MSKVFTTLKDVMGKFIDELRNELANAIAVYEAKRDNAIRHKLGYPNPGCKSTHEDY